MKHIFIPLSTVIFLIGCGLMSNPKETPQKTPQESQKIHVPQNITVGIPKELQQTKSSSSNQKMRQGYWFN